MKRTIATLLICCGCDFALIEEENQLLVKEQQYLKEEIRRLEKVHLEIQTILANILAEKAINVLDRLGINKHGFKITDGTITVGECDGKTGCKEKTEAQRNSKTEN